VRQWRSSRRLDQLLCGPASEPRRGGTARLLLAHLAASVFRGSTSSHFRQTSLVRPVRSVMAIKRLLHSGQRLTSIASSSSKYVQRLADRYGCGARCCSNGLAAPARRGRRENNQPARQPLADYIRYTCCARIT
jgi:hypothetical protein